jgi:hypothetical protein
LVCFDNYLTVVAIISNEDKHKEGRCEAVLDNLNVISIFSLCEILLNFNLELNLHSFLPNVTVRQYVEILSKEMIS